MFFLKHRFKDKVFRCETAKEVIDAINKYRIPPALVEIQQFDGPIKIISYESLIQKAGNSPLTTSDVEEDFSSFIKILHENLLNKYKVSLEITTLYSSLTGSFQEFIDTGRDLDNPLVKIEARVHTTGNDKAVSKFSSKKFRAIAKVIDSDWEIAYSRCQPVMFLPDRTRIITAIFEKHRSLF